MDWDLDRVRREDERWCPPPRPLRLVLDDLGVDLGVCLGVGGVEKARTGDGFVEDGSLPAAETEAEAAASMGEGQRSVLREECAAQ